MERNQFVKAMTYLGMAYGKSFTQEEVELYYDFLKEYQYESLVAAIKKFVKKSKYVPKINELIEECEKTKITKQFDVVEYMKDMGYFKSPIEYDKTIHFMQRGIVPEWLQRDINKYYQMMINGYEKIAHPNRLQLK